MGQNKKIFPKKLSYGDEIRIISPACSLGIIGQDVRKIACQRLELLGLKVSFSKNCEELDAFKSSSVASRIQDLHEAFSDNKIKGILTTLGGYNSNQLLDYLDYDLIAKNPKFFCGYSDITALQNAFFAKVGLISYSGPHFSTFGCLHGIEYMLESFKNAAFTEKKISIKSAETWSDDPWYLDQDNRNFEKSAGYYSINFGKASGNIIGGNITTLNMLQGTAYMPSLQNSILFIEDDDLTNPAIFDRSIQSLILQNDFSGVKGVVIGRFQKGSNISENLLRKIISSKAALQSIPVIAGVDFGHTMPILTFPIGGYCEIDADMTHVKINLS